MTRSVWAPGFERWPWTTFADGVRLDAIHRRIDAMLAILDWPDASAALRLDAQTELDRAEADASDWERGIDVAAAAYCSWPT